MRGKKKKWGDGVGDGARVSNFYLESILFGWGGGSVS